MFQGSQDVAATVTSAQCTQVVSYMHTPLAAASSYAQPTGRKRPRAVDDGEQESEVNATTLDIKRPRPSLNAMDGQVRRLAEPLGCPTARGHVLMGGGQTIYLDLALANRLSGSRTDRN